MPVVLLTIETPVILETFFLNLTSFLSDLIIVFRQEKMERGNRTLAFTYFMNVLW